MRLRLEHRDDTLTLATAPNVLVAAWTGMATVEAIELVERLNRQQRREHPEGAAMLDLILRGTASFSPEVVEVTRRSHAAVDGWRTATAHVFLIDGFAAVAVRSFLNTINLVSRAKRPTKIFEDLPTAVEWLSAQLDGHPSKTWREDALVGATADLVATCLAHRRAP